MAEAGERVTGDEEDWAASALYHAAKNLVLGGQPLAAAALVHKLPAKDQGEIRELVLEAGRRVP